MIGKHKLIRQSKSCIGDAEKRSVIAVLNKEFLGMGAEVQKFERDLSEFLGRTALCVVNGTSALHLALQACDLGVGDEVLVPSLTYIASFQAISATGAKPVACDIDETTLMLDLSDAQKRLTKETKAIMPVHYSGGVGDLNAVFTFAQKHNLRVIEDAAHAFGTIYQNKRIGSFGDVTCFSFDGIKNITSGEGGCIVTDDKAVLKKVRDARLLGIEKDSKKRYVGKRSWNFEVSAQGWRYHMSDIMASIGIEQLKQLPTFAQKRQQLAKRYDLLFSGHPKIHSLSRDYEEVIPHIYVVRIKGMKNRNIIRDEMLNKGIQTGYHYQPNHWLEFYKEDDSLQLPTTELVFPELLSLPLHPDLSVSDVEFVAETLINCIS